MVSADIEEMPILSDDVIKKYIDREEEINIKLNLKICCAELVGTNLRIDAACANYKCGKPVATLQGDRIVTCMNCSNTLIVKKVWVHLQLCVITKNYYCYYWKYFAIITDRCSVPVFSRKCHEIVSTWRKNVKRQAVLFRKCRLHVQL